MLWISLGKYFFIVRPLWIETPYLSGGSNTFYNGGLLQSSFIDSKDNQAICFHQKKEEQPPPLDFAYTCVKICYHFVSLLQPKLFWTFLENRRSFLGFKIYMNIKSFIYDITVNSRMRNTAYTLHILFTDNNHDH